MRSVCKSIFVSQDNAKLTWFMPWYLELRQSFCISKLSNWKKTFQTIFFVCFCHSRWRLRKLFFRKTFLTFQATNGLSNKKKNSLSGYTLQIWCSDKALFTKSLSIKSKLYSNYYDSYHVSSDLRWASSWSALRKISLNCWFINLRKSLQQEISC